jgi:hypothetical protein
MVVVIVSGRRSVIAPVLGVCPSHICWRRQLREFTARPYIFCFPSVCCACLLVLVGELYRGTIIISPLPIPYPCHCVAARLFGRVVPLFELQASMTMPSYHGWMILIRVRKRMLLGSFLCFSFQFSPNPSRKLLPSPINTRTDVSFSH